MKKLPKPKKVVNGQLWLWKLDGHQYLVDIQPLEKFRPFRLVRMTNDAGYPVNNWEYQRDFLRSGQWVYLGVLNSQEDCL